MYTSSYDVANNLELTNTLSISRDKGRSADYSGKYFSLLAPKYEM